MQSIRYLSLHHEMDVCCAYLCNATRMCYTLKCPVKTCDQTKSANAL